MTSRRFRIAASAAVAAASLLVALDAAHGVTIQRRFRLVRGSDAKALQQIPSIFAIAPRTCVPDLPGVDDPELAPELLGASFDPAHYDEISVARSGQLIAYATTLSEAGIPGATKQVVLLPAGPGETSVRIAKVGAGNNDQPSVQFDELGFRCVFRASTAASSSIQLHSFRERGETDDIETVDITESAAVEDFEAFDPALTARTRLREVGGGIKVRERDARVAFVSTGDLTAESATKPGSNPDELEQLFRWEEQSKVFRQITKHDDPDASVNRPAISKSGDVIVFECTADLEPASVDPLDSSRVGNPGHVRQLFLWRLGRGIEQITWSDGDCFSPRMDDAGRFVLFCSRGDPLTGGNPERNLEIFAWVARSRPHLRLRQLTQTAEGDSVLPRPSARANQFVFWSTARPPRAYPDDLVDPVPPSTTNETPEFGDGRPQCTPQALLYDRGRVRHVHGLLDVENALRLLPGFDPANPQTPTSALNPIVTGPPAVGRDAVRIFFGTNDFRLSAAITQTTGESDLAFGRRKRTASLFSMFIAMATRVSRP